MPDTVSRRHGLLVLLCASEGTKLGNDRDAVELIGAAAAHHADLVAIPTERLDDHFFRLHTRIAGDILQKFVNYRLRLAIVGDISAHLAASASLRDFVYESNRGRHVWFVADLAALDERLERLHRQGLPGG